MTARAGALRQVGRTVGAGHRLAPRPRADVRPRAPVADGTGGAPRAVGGRAAAAAGALQPVRLLMTAHAAALTRRQRARVVVTDRLHAHVLCTMFAVPHVLLDDGYGKIRAFLDTWPVARGRAELAASPEDAAERAARPAGRDLRRPQMTSPPLGEMHWPVTNELSSLAR